MKKIRDRKFLCLEFANSDLSKTATMSCLVKHFLRLLNRISSKEYDSWSEVPAGVDKKDKFYWRARLMLGRKALRKIQERTIEFVKFLLAPRESEESKFAPLLRVLFRDEREHIRTYFGSDFKFPISLVLEAICLSLQKLYAELSRKRVIACSRCGKFSISKTRKPRKFCSDKCRYAHHNEEKQRTGKHAVYMKLHMRQLRRKRRTQGGKEEPNQDVRSPLLDQTRNRLKIC